MEGVAIKQIRRVRRKRRVRKRVYGTAERPRLSVSRSLRHINVQIIDDDRGVTLCHVSSMNKDVRPQVGYGGNKAAATQIGKLLAERAKAAGINKVVFDRNGYRFHGRLAALAAAARENGLEF